MINSELKHPFATDPRHSSATAAPLPEAVFLNKQEQAALRGRTRSRRLQRSIFAVINPLSVDMNSRSDRFPTAAANMNRKNRRSSRAGLYAGGNAPNSPPTNCCVNFLTLTLPHTDIVDFCQKAAIQGLRSLSSNRPAECATLNELQFKEPDFPAGLHNCLRSGLGYIRRSLISGAVQ